MEDMGRASMLRFSQNYGAVYTNIVIMEMYCRRQEWEVKESKVDCSYY